MTGPSRRGVLTGAAGVVVGAGAGAGTAHLLGREATGGDDVVPFHGGHQAGITTPAQERMLFASFDVTTTRRDELADLLRAWTAAAARLTRGRPVAAPADTAVSPPTDTGEAIGLGPARLTLTVGFGPSLFDHRFDLQERRPAALAPLPVMPGDDLDPARSDGDLCVQACADDPQVAFHAVRNLARIARGRAVLRWSQQGFGRTSATGADQATPRNLMGFKDGTRNIRADDTAALNRHVRVGAEGDQAWMRGGSYLVARRIRMLIESWDVESLAHQERVFGRTKVAGAPLTGHAEGDVPDFAAMGPDGLPVIAAHAHIRLAAPDSNDGVRILRRGYSYTDGIDPVTGFLDAGLFFVCFCQDAHRQFVPIQRRLGSVDLLSEYLRHTGSALFACPPGVRSSEDWWGRQLFVA